MDILVCDEHGNKYGFKGCGLKYCEVTKSLTLFDLDDEDEIFAFFNKISWYMRNVNPERF